MKTNGNRQIIEFRSIVAASAAEVFKWHWQPGTINRLMPPWEKVEVEHPAQEPLDGSTALLKIKLGPFKLNWLAKHCEVISGLQFVDIQEKGPFAYWRHLHKFEPIENGKCTLIDHIEYELHAAPLTQKILGDYINKKLKRLFNYRHELTAADVALLKIAGGRVMKILVTGARGLVGSKLIPFLKSLGHQVVRLVRNCPEKEDILWQPRSGEIDKNLLEGFDAVIHLAGDNIASGRWTEKKKGEIRSSRVQGTKLLCEILASLKKPPEVIISASAIGYYGNRSQEVLTEDSQAGTGFLAEVCQEWESAAQPARDAGIRVANLRIGVVLSCEGGALTKMLPAFQMGAGGKLGSGKQWMSWISAEDLIGTIYHILMHKELEGPINAVAPEAVTNSEFTTSLGSVLHRPTMFDVPVFAINLLLGEMANELLLTSTLVKPNKLVASGYVFRHPTLEPTLRQLLGAA